MEHSHINLISAMVSFFFFYLLVFIEVSAIFINNFSILVFGKLYFRWSNARALAHCL